MVDIMWIQQGYAGDTMKSDVTDTCNCQDLGVTENEDTHKQWHLKWRTWWWMMEFSVFHIFSHAHGATSQYSNLAFVRRRIWSSRTWRSVQKMSKASWCRLFVSSICFWKWGIPWNSRKLWSFFMWNVMISRCGLGYPSSVGPGLVSKLPRCLLPMFYFSTH